MDLQLTTAPQVSATGCAILPIFAEKTMSASAKTYDSAHGGMIQQALELQGFSGEAETSLYIPKLQKGGANAVLLVGCGKANELTPLSWTRMCNHVAGQLKTVKLTEAEWYLADIARDDFSEKRVMQIAVMALQQSVYQFKAFKSKQDPTPTLDKVNFVVTDVNAKLRDQLAQSKAVQLGMTLCKDLGNTPANVCTPTYLAERATQLSSKYSSIKTTILDEEEMKDIGMNSLLSVSKGSDEPAKLILMEYRGAKNQDAPPHALVGKGITFDSGGISIKPSANMDEMKYDMCGAASVMGTLLAIAEMKLPINVIGAIAASENLPGGKASKPGDIVTSLSGKTIEILNTDAEGRLVLCDALTYIERYKPASVIDIATLTGAMIIALGHEITGMMSNTEALANELIHAGKCANDLVWYLPMNENYEKVLESNFADMANISWDRSAGSITAACFLSKFTKNFRWAHLDIAGTAWNSGKEKGATGRPIPLLVQYLVDRSHDAS